MLDELVGAAGPDVRFYCLVRGRDSGQGGSTNRVLDTLRFYGLAGHSAGDRIVPVAGDLTQPRMGLDNDEYQRLAEEVDLIFHCAASVNYAYPYSAAKPHTVGGTLEVLKFACSGATKPIQYISSNGIFPGGDDTPYLESNEIDGFMDRMEGATTKPSGLRNGWSGRLFLEDCRYASSVRATLATTAVRAWSTRMTFSR